MQELLATHEAETHYRLEEGDDYGAQAPRRTRLGSKCHVKEGIVFALGAREVCKFGEESGSLRPTRMCTAERAWCASSNWPDVQLPRGRAFTFRESPRCAIALGKRNFRILRCSLSESES